jgi:hypothetical protein
VTALAEVEEDMALAASEKCIERSSESIRQRKMPGAARRRAIIE